MKHLLKMALPLLLIVLLGGGCAKEEAANLTAPPMLTVKCGEVTLPSTFGLNSWNGAVIDRVDTLNFLLSDSPELPYLPLDSVLSLSLADGRNPDSYTLTDIIITPEGNEAYSERERVNREIQFADGSAELTLSEHMAAFLSSSTAAYEPGVTLRGFRLVCRWGIDECEYAFALRTDAGIIESVE